MIRNIINPGSYTQKINIAFLFLRIAIGITMLTHGVSKLIHLLSDSPIQFVDPIGIGDSTSLVLVVFAEVFGSILLIFGAATMLAVIPLFITMLVAILVVYWADAFGVKEVALLYLSVYITIAVTGAGKYSVDNLLYKKIDF